MSLYTKATSSELDIVNFYITDKTGAIIYSTLLKEAYSNTLNISMRGAQWLYVNCASDFVDNFSLTVYPSGIYDVVDYIFDNLKLSFKPKIYSYKNRSLFEFKLYNYEDMKAFGDFMYKDSTVYLKRKKEKFDVFLKAYENYKDNTEISMESKESIPS
jgi:hypothetical protein